MKWVIDNWSLLVIMVCVLIVAGLRIFKFSQMPTDAQIAKIKEWLLYAVIAAEKEFKNGTGALKLRYVYDLFVQRFGDVAAMIPFEVFAAWVDDALVNMRHLLETNKDIDAYVYDE